ncbi:unnamed protein product [Gongylonema pulchrum]|uniref:Chloride channel CLIC-like protein 1 n=1 Tax=Gongylonema pulchrum TaxID=637853 RepID=A0A183DTY4_9BILA|nr:unnamed protein product [Gongylonema pulchrum]
MLSVLICLALSTATSNGDEIDFDLSVDRTNWIDPNDPLAQSSFCARSTLDQLARCRIDLEECLKGNKKEISALSHTGKYYTHDPTLKHIIRNFLSRMHVDIDTKETSALSHTGKYYTHDPTLKHIIRNFLSRMHVDIDTKETSALSHTGKYYTHDPTLKHIIRNFLSRMHVDIDTAKYIERTVDVSVNAENTAILRNYLNSKDETVSEREQVRVILEELVVPCYEFFGEKLKICDRFLKEEWDGMGQVDLVAVMPHLLYFCLYRFGWKSLRVVFFHSTYFDSLFNYRFILVPFRENIAARMSRAEKSVREECGPKSLFSAALELASSWVFLKSKSECLQYYEDVYIDPVYQISPLNVISDVLSNFIFTPLGVFGRHFNTFCNEFYRDSPLWLVVIKTIVGKANNMFCPSDFTFSRDRNDILHAAYLTKNLIIYMVAERYAKHPSLHRSVRHSIFPSQSALLLFCFSE